MTFVPQVIKIDSSSPSVASSEDLFISRLVSLSDIQETKSGVTRTTIENLSSFGYQVRDPIPVEIEYCAEDEFIASWPEGGIAITSDSATDALQTLKVEIVEVYQIFKNERLLGPEPQRQLSLLEKHLGEG